jgi:hypothetical protein
MYVVECICGERFQGYVASHNTQGRRLIHHVNQEDGLGALRFSTPGDVLAWIEDHGKDGFWLSTQLCPVDLDYSPPDEPVRPPVAEGG